jgi:Tripartite tricarboxylate transporter TctB family
MRLIRNPRDFYAGLLFVSFGVAALVLSGSYPLGSAARMGPGYFPRVLGTLVVGLGAVLCLRGFKSTAEVQSTWHWRPLIIVLASVGFFSLTAQWLGLALSGLALVLVSSAASREFRWKEALISGVVLGVSAVVVFVYGLGMPLPVWPTFIGGR